MERAGSGKVVRYVYDVSGKLLRTEEDPSYSPSDPSQHPKSSDDLPKGYLRDRKPDQKRRDDELDA